MRKKSTVSKAKTVSGCKCIGLVNAKLAEFNTQLDCRMSIDFATGKPKPPLLVISTVKIDTSKRKPATPVVASFCPFCGKVMPT